MGRSKGGSQVCTVWRPGSGFPLTGQLLIQKCCHLIMLKNRWHSPQLQHGVVDIPINCFFPWIRKVPTLYYRSEHKKPVFMGCPWSVVWCHEDLDFHIHGCYACLSTFPQEAVCGYVYIHNSHVIIDSSFIMHLKKPWLKVFVFCFSSRLEGKAQYGTQVCRGVGVRPKTQSHQKLQMH
jgi:hypothetical protein